MRPIADYGLLGDTRTAALVSSDGSIDWFCVPRFDGAPVFGSLLGGVDGGTFRLGPAEAGSVVERRYREHCTTLETTWATPHGRLTLTEGMVAEVAGCLPRVVPQKRSSSSTPASARTTTDRGSGAAVRPWCASGGRWRCPSAATQDRAPRSAARRR